MKNKEIFIKIIYYFLIFSFIGWTWEVIYRFIRSRIFINRGMVHGPISPFYGFGMLILVFVFNKLINFNKIKKKPVIVFISCACISSLFELIGGIFLNKIWHMKWWDYSSFFLNINGYICFKSFICFGIFGIIALYFIIPFLEKIYIKYNSKILKIVLYILFIIYLIDQIYSFFYPNIGYKITY